MKALAIPNPELSDKAAQCPPPARSTRPQRQGVTRPTWCAAFWAIVSALFRRQVVARPLGYLVKGGHEGPAAFGQLVGTRTATRTSTSPR